MAQWSFLHLSQVTHRTLGLMTESGVRKMRQRTTLFIPKEIVMPEIALNNIKKNP